jgi:MoxR-like ATPase
VIPANHKPLTILTSNGTRMISDALRRRCLYLYIGYPECEREVAIVRGRFPELCVGLARQMVEFLRKVRELNLRKHPSVSETLDWAKVLSLLHASRLTPEVVANTVGVIAKHQADLQPVLDLAARELG